MLERWTSPRSLRSLLSTSRWCVFSASSCAKISSAFRDVPRTEVAMRRRSPPRAAAATGPRSKDLLPPALEQRHQSHNARHQTITSLRTRRNNSRNESTTVTSHRVELVRRSRQTRPAPFRCKTQGSEVGQIIPGVESRGTHRSRWRASATLPPFPGRGIAPSTTQRPSMRSRSADEAHRRNRSMIEAMKPSPRPRRAARSRASCARGAVLVPRYRRGVPRRGPPQAAANRTRPLRPELESRDRAIR